MGKRGRPPGPWTTKKPILIYLRPPTHTALLHLAITESAKAGGRISVSKIVEGLIERHLRRKR